MNHDLKHLIIGYIVYTNCMTNSLDVFSERKVSHLNFLWTEHRFNEKWLEFKLENGGK